MAKADAGYSGTPLPQKLGIKENHKVCILGAPRGFSDTLGALPTGATVQTKLAGKASLDVIIVFITKASELAGRITDIRPRMQPAAGLWIAWPKKASSVQTDMTEHVVRDVGLPTG